MGYILRKSPVIKDRKYPDGDPIPDALPELYRNSNRCNNCAAYIPGTRFCTAWNSVVRPDYVCAGWEPIKA